jgi:hypothetical protein
MEREVSMTVQPPLFLRHQPIPRKPSSDTEESDDGQVIGTKDQMETFSIGNDHTEEAEDAAECIKHTNLNNLKVQKGSSGIRMLQMVIPKLAQSKLPLQ